MTNTQIDFRQLARDCLDRAKTELSAGYEHRLRYAALELRFAMEALTYDRALAFKDDLPPEEYKVWQADKLMKVLVAIDPAIGSTSIIFSGKEDELGKPARRDNMKLRGEDRVFGVADITKYFNRIGSYLHAPCPKNIQQGNHPDIEKLRTTCEAIVGRIENVLASPVWNCTLGYVSTIECINDACKKPVHRRMPRGKEVVEAECIECKAEYTLTRQDDGQVLWTPKMNEAPCSNPECHEKMRLWPRETKPGTRWRCHRCGAHNEITLSVTSVETGQRTTGSE